LASRVRRVKCDEGKPECARCLKFGVECDGYETKRTPKKEIVAIVPKRELAIKEQSLPAFPALQLQPDLTFHLRGEAEDTQYFRFFRDETAYELSGGFFDEPIWNQMILQSCHEAPCIQKIALSIAGLSRAMKANSYKESKDPHVEYALQQYTKSLRHFRLFVASNGSPDPRMLLMAGLLIYVFECLQGNMDNAIKQIKAMMSVFKNMRSLKQLDYSHLHCKGSFENELVSEIARLDGQLMGRTHPDSGQLSIIGIQHGHLWDPFSVPKRFEDMRSARRMLEHLQHLSRPDIVHDERANLIPPPGWGPEWPHSEEHITVMKEALAQWWVAFKPIFDFACTPEGDDTFVPAGILRITAIATALILQSKLTMNQESAKDSYSDRLASLLLIKKRRPSLFENLAREMLDDCQKVIAHRRFARGFVFNNGIICPLWILMIMTNNREMVVEVRDHLREMAPRREGYWNSVVILETAEALLARRDAEGWSYDGS
jgi:Fungal Zn(2)-Cys(6) binuclear cluster domain